MRWPIAMIPKPRSMRPRTPWTSSSLRPAACLEGARSTLDQAQEEYDRQTSLFERGLSSDAEFKRAKYAYLNATASYQASQAQTKQLESRFEMQMDNLSKAKIVAPMSGVITFVDCEVGEIAAAQTPYTQGRTLMTISNLESFEVEVEVDETEINKIELRQFADIEVDAFPDTTFAGEVIEIGNTAITQGYGTTEQSTNFKVKVLFTDRTINLRPGMSATADITTADRLETLTIPYSAVVMRSLDMDSLERARQAVPESSGAVVGEVHAAETDDSMTDSASGSDEDEREELKGVFVIREGTAHFVIIETGIADQKNIEVVSGLEDGDSVVSGPYRVLRTIRDGDEVEIRKGERDEGEA